VRGRGRWSGCSSFVATVKTADLGQFHDAAQVQRVDRSWLGCVFAERKMGSGPVIVGEVAFQNAEQVTFSGDDDVIQAFPTNRADQAFRIRILPGGPGRGERFLDAQALHSAAEHLAVDTVATIATPNGSCVSTSVTTAGRIADCGCKRRAEATGCHRCELCRRRPCAAGCSSAGYTTSRASQPEHRARASTLAPWAGPCTFATGDTAQARPRASTASPPARTTCALSSRSGCAFVEPNCCG
jgi:hypothetical protein